LLAAWLTLALAPAGEARANDFYSGKVINIYIGTGEGPGALSAYPRAIAQVIGKYIPGNPAIIVRNMPGAGGIKAANFIYGIAPQDGTAWGFITRGFVRAPLLGTPQAQFDPTRYQWIGTTSQETSVAAVWAPSTRVRSLADAMTEDVVFGGTSLASLGILRPIARAHLHMPAALRTGTAALVGARAVVLQRVDQNGGRVRIGGEEWSARAFMPDQVLEPGTKVEVVKIEGATALVLE